MGNYFRLLVEAPDRATMIAHLPDEDVLAWLSIFRDEQATRVTLSDLRMERENGHAEGVGKIAAFVRERLFDLSAFIEGAEAPHDALVQQAARVEGNALGAALQVLAGRGRRRGSDGGRLH